MNYTPTNWANGKAPALSAENLNKIETELVNLHNKIDSAVEILNTTDDTTNQNLQIVQKDVTDLKGADIAINKNFQALGDEVEGLKETDNTINQTLQTVQNDVTELKQADESINQTLQTVQNDVKYLKENSGGTGGNVPTKVSQLENDLGYVTSDEIEEEVNGLKEADNTINQTLQTIQDDVENLKANGGGSTDNSVDITETTETTMPNSHEGRLLFKEIRGKTEQATSTGSQLFDSSNVELGSISSVLGIKEDNTTICRTINPISVNPSTKYVLSYTNNGNNIRKIRVFQYDSAMNYIESSIADSEVPFETNQNAKYLHMHMSGTSFPADTTLNIGETPLPWEPYTGGIPAQYIKSVTISGIKTYKKNLFDGKNQGNYLDIKVENGGITDVDTGFVIKVNGGVYTISSTETQERFRVACSNYNHNTFHCYNGVNKDGQSGSITIDCTGYSYLVVNASDLTKIQVEKGEDATEYEPYCGSSFTFSQSIELSDSDKIINTGNGFSLIVGETKTELPTADQVALNSLKTCDGITYLEFDSPLQPEFVAEYGASKVGGYTLEAKGENIEVMNRILQDAFIPRETSNHVSDANTCLKSGIYRTYDDTANVKYTNGFLLVFAIDPNTMVVQINMLWDPRYIYIRTYWWGTWHGWYKIATELDLTALQTAMVNNI